MPSSEGSSAHPSGLSHIYSILATYRPDHLPQFLQVLAQQDPPLHELILVDNSPAPGIERLARDYQSAGLRITYVARPENIGFGGGIATGMRLVLERARDHDWITILDDENPPHTPTLYREMQTFAESMIRHDPSTAAVAITGARFNRRTGRTDSIPDEELGGPIPVDYVPGGQFPLYRVGVVRENGFFDERLFLGFVDLDYGMRLRAKGHSLYAHGELWGARTEGGRTRLKQGVTYGLPRDKRSALWRRYYSLRNLIYIARLHGHILAATRITVGRGILKPLLNLPLHPREAWKLLLVNGKACFHGWRGTLGKTVDPV